MAWPSLFPAPSSRQCFCLFAEERSTSPSSRIWLRFSVPRCQDIWVTNKWTMENVGVSKSSFNLGTINPSYAKCDAWTNSTGIAGGIIRNAESQAPTKTVWIRICILSGYLNGLYAPNEKLCHQRPYPPHYEKYFPYYLFMFSSYLSNYKILILFW